jgi:exonuclease III
LINVRSIAKKFDLIREFIDRNRIDVLFICETWADETFSDAMFSFDHSFHVIRKDRKSKKRSGGVAILIRKSFHCAQVDINSRFETCETVAIDVISL